MRQPEKYYWNIDIGQEGNHYLTYQFDAKKYVSFIKIIHENLTYNNNIMLNNFLEIVSTGNRHIHPTKILSFKLKFSTYHPTPNALFLIGLSRFFSDNMIFIFGNDFFLQKLVNILLCIYEKYFSIQKTVFITFLNLSHVWILVHEDICSFSN